MTTTSDSIKNGSNSVTPLSTKKTMRKTSTPAGEDDSVLASQTKTPSPRRSDSTSLSSPSKQARFATPSPQAPKLKKKNEEVKASVNNNEEKTSKADLNLNAVQTSVDLEVSQTEMSKSENSEKSQKEATDDNASNAPAVSGNANKLERDTQSFSITSSVSNKEKKHTTTATATTAEHVAKKQIPGLSDAATIASAIEILDYNNWERWSKYGQTFYFPPGSDESFPGYTESELVDHLKTEYGWMDRETKRAMAKKEAARKKKNETKDATMSPKKANSTTNSKSTTPTPTGSPSKVATKENKPKSPTSSPTKAAIPNKAKPETTSSPQKEEQPKRTSGRKRKTRMQEGNDDNNGSSTASRRSTRRSRSQSMSSSIASRADEDMFYKFNPLIKFLQDKLDWDYKPAKDRLFDWSYIRGDSELGEKGVYLVDYFHEEAEVIDYCRRHNYKEKFGHLLNEKGGEKEEKGRESNTTTDAVTRMNTDTSTTPTTTPARKKLKMTPTKDDHDETSPAPSCVTPLQTNNKPC